MNYDKKKLNMIKHRVWKDKNINQEYKRLFAYLYSKGFEKNSSFSVRIGDVQVASHITNVGFRKCLRVLEKFKYLIYQEYDKGMYEIKIY